MNPRRLTSRASLGTIIILGGSLLLASCSSESSPEESASQESASQSTAQIVAPVMKDPEDLDGSEVSTSVGREVVVMVEDDAADWTGSTDDAGVATFLAGGTKGSAEFNPGFTPVAPGRTQATLTDPQGVTITFTLVVDQA